jgi:hypothetical protein
MVQKRGSGETETRRNSIVHNVRGLLGRQWKNIKHREEESFAICSRETMRKFVTSNKVTNIAGPNVDTEMLLTAL